MKIIVKHYDNIYSVHTHEDLDIHELVERFAGLAMQMGYSEDTVRNGFQEIEL